MTTLNLGFIGLGIRGTPMAAHLRPAIRFTSTHARHRRRPSWTPGGVACVSVTKVAQKAETSFTMVPNTLMSRKCCLTRMVSLPL